jgi:flavodoxin I
MGEEYSMKALIVYDSFFGNTEKVAQEIGKALSTHGFVSVVKADQVSPEQLEGVDLLILGSPTRAFTYSPNVKAFLRKLKADALKGVKVAAFDTRFHPEEKTSKFLKGLVKVFGYAAEPMLKTMEKKGGAQAVPASWFIVNGSEGPLKDGELERAAAWAEEIFAAL